jgi:hypothetical protein
MFPFVWPGDFVSKSKAEAEILGLEGTYQLVRIRKEKAQTRKIKVPSFLLRMVRISFLPKLIRREFKLP